MLGGTIRRQKRRTMRAKRSGWGFGAGAFLCAWNENPERSGARPMNKMPGRSQTERKKVTARRGETKAQTGKTDEKRETLLIWKH